MAKKATGEKHQSYTETARAGHARTVEILQQLGEKKSLSEYDRKWLEDLKAKLETTSSN